MEASSVELRFWQVIQLTQSPAGACANTFMEDTGCRRESKISKVIEDFINIFILFLPEV